MPAGTGADDADLEAGRFDMRNVAPLFLDGGVADEALQAADRHRLQRLADNADAFALRLLRADAAAHRGQQIAGGDDVVGAADILGGDRLDEFRNVDVDRAAGNASRLRTHDAALGFVERFGQVIAAIDLFEILHPHLRIELAHRRARLRNGANGFLFLSCHSVNPDLQTDTTSRSCLACRGDGRRCLYPPSVSSNGSGKPNAGSPLALRTGGVIFIMRQFSDQRASAAFSSSA